jgi:heat shock protein HslJ
LTLEFRADGSLRGSGGCNDFNGSFTVNDSGLLASTRMAWVQPEGRMAQEAAFLAALETATSAHREGDRLDLRTASGDFALAARLSVSH